MEIVSDETGRYATDYAFILAAYLLNCLDPDYIDLTPLKVLKQSNKVAARLSNWNLIAEVVEEVRTKIFEAKVNPPLIDTDIKNLLIAQDRATFKMIQEKTQKLVHAWRSKLDQIKASEMLEAERIRDQQEIERKPETQAEIDKNTYESSLMFILQTLTDALDLPNLRQAAAFLTNENQYLAKACAKGLKGGDFSKIIKWYILLESKVQELSDLLLCESDSFESVYKTISVGLSSTNQEVGERCCRVLGELLRSGHLKSIEVYNLRHYLDIITKCPYILKLISQKVLARLYYDRYTSMVYEIFRLNDEQLPFVPEIISVCGIENDQEALRQFVLKAVEMFDSKNLVYLQMVVESWRLSPEVMDKVQEYSTGNILDLVLANLIKICRDGPHVVRISALVIIFQHLQFLARMKNPQAGSLFKVLTFSFIQNYPDELIREIMVSSFVDLFSTHRSIPVDILLEPLLKHLNQERRIIELDSFDYKLLYSIVLHNKLKLGGLMASMPGHGGHAIDLIQYLTNLTISQPLQCLQTTSLIVQLFVRFRNEHVMQCSVCSIFEQFMDRFMDSHKRMHVNRCPHESLFLVPLDDYDDEDDLTYQLRAGSIIKIAYALFDEATEEIRSVMRDIVDKTQEEFVKLFGRENQALLQLQQRHMKQQEILIQQQPDKKPPALMQEAVVNLIHLGHIPEGDYARPDRAKKGYSRKKKVDSNDPRGFDEIQRELEQKIEEIGENFDNKAEVKENIEKIKQTNSKIKKAKTFRKPIPALPEIQIENADVKKSEHNRSPRSDNYVERMGNSAHNFDKEDGRGSAKNSLIQDGFSRQNTVPLKTRVIHFEEDSERPVEKRSMHMIESEENLSQEQPPTEKVEEIFSEKPPENEEKAPEQNPQPDQGVQVQPRRLSRNSNYWEKSEDHGEIVDIPAPQLIKMKPKKKKKKKARGQSARPVRSNQLVMLDGWTIKAIKNIELIKLKKDLMSHEKEHALNMLALKEERQKRMFQAMRNRNKLSGAPIVYKSRELMVSDNLGDLIEQQILSPRQVSQLNSGLKPQVEILDIQSEEVRDQEALYLVVQNYSKVLRFLFGKYSMTTAQKAKFATFDFYKDKTINQGELNRLIRDHSVDQHMLSKQNIIDLYKGVNMHFQKRVDMAELSYNLYEIFLLQLSFFLFPNAGSMAASFQNLIDHFEMATQAKGQSIHLYRDPKGMEMLSQDQLLQIQVYEQNLLENKKIVLPEGLMIVRESEQVTQYKVPECVPEASKIGIELLDEIVFMAVGIHFLEPIVKTQIIQKVRPKLTGGRINNKIIGVVSALNLTKALPTPALSSARKLSPIKSVPQIAKWEVEQTQNYSQFETPSKIIMKMQDKKKEVELKKMNEIDERNRKFMKRKIELKSQLQEQESQRQKEMAENQEARLKIELENQKKQQNQKETQLKKNEEQKKAVEQRRKEQLDEAVIMKKELDRLAELEKKKKKLASKEFIEKQNEKITRANEAKILKLKLAQERKEYLEQKRKQKEAQRREDSPEGKVSKNIARGEKTFEELQIDRRESEVVKELLENEEIIRAFLIHEKQLTEIFKKYSAKENRNEIRLYSQTVGLQEFIQLGHYSGLLGNKDLTNDDVKHVFKTVVKEREVRISLHELNFENFQMAILRLYILRTGQANSQDLPEGAGVVALNALKSIDGAERIKVSAFKEFLKKLSQYQLNGFFKNIDQLRNPKKEDQENEIEAEESDNFGQDYKEEHNQVIEPIDSHKHSEHSAINHPLDKMSHIHASVFSPNQRPKIAPQSPTLSLNHNDFKPAYTLPPEEQQVTSGNEATEELQLNKMETSMVPDRDVILRSPPTRKTEDQPEKISEKNFF